MGIKGWGPVTHAVSLYPLPGEGMEGSLMDVEYLGYLIRLFKVSEVQGLIMG